MMDILSLTQNNLKLMWYNNKIVFSLALQSKDYKTNAIAV